MSRSLTYARTITLHSVDVEHPISSSNNRKGHEINERA